MKFLWVALLFAGGCQSVGTPSVAAGPAGSVTYRVVAAGSDGASVNSVDDPAPPEVSAAHDAASLRQIWNRDIGGGPLPVADFHRRSIVVLSLGTRPTGGFGIDVQRVTLEGTTLVVEARVVTPQPKALTTQAFTAPYLALEVDASSFQHVQWRDQSRLVAAR